jgi:hypothetical protein
MIASISISGANNCVSVILMNPTNIGLLIS